MSPFDIFLFQCTLQLQVPSIFMLHYAPWGNAKLVDSKFECQHGPMECTMNTVQACALNYYPNMYVGMVTEPISTVCVCVCVCVLLTNH